MKCCKCKKDLDYIINYEIKGLIYCKNCKIEKEKMSRIEENQKIENILNQAKEKFKDNFKTEITQQKFRNKTTGEIVTRFSLMDIANFEKVE